MVYGNYEERKTSVFHQLLFHCWGIAAAHFLLKSTKAGVKITPAKSKQIMELPQIQYLGLN